MIRLQEHFPETYKDTLSCIPQHAARAIRAIYMQLRHCPKDHVDDIIRSMHDYAQISEAALRSLDLSLILADHPKEIDDYYDRHANIDLEQLCADLTKALFQDEEIQKRIIGSIINYCCFELQEEYEDCVIHNLPQ